MRGMYVYKSIFFLTAPQNFTWAIVIFFEPLAAEAALQPPQSRFARQLPRLGALS
jgi:hypothetical protein